MVAPRNVKISLWKHVVQTLETQQHAKQSKKRAQCTCTLMKIAVISTGNQISSNPNKGGTLDQSSLIFDQTLSVDQPCF
jgi:hypothetical protein